MLLAPSRPSTLRCVSYVGAFSLEKAHIGLIVFVSVDKLRLLFHRDGQVVHCKVYPRTPVSGIYRKAISGYGMNNDCFTHVRFPSSIYILISVAPHVSPSVLCCTSDTVTYLANFSAVYEPNAIARCCIELARRTFDAKKVWTCAVDGVACLETGQQGRIVITRVWKVRISGR